MTYKAYYYLKQSGRVPLEEYLENLKDKRLEAHIKALIDRLIEKECRLPWPFIKHIWEKIYELRLEHHNARSRIFYFIFEKGKIILLDGYTKKSQKIPHKVLSRIQNHYLDYLNHHYEKPY